MAGLPFVEVVGEHAKSHADLRRGEADARGVEHRLGEIGDERSQFLVEDGHRIGGSTQDGIAEQADDLNSHAPIL